MQHAGPSAVAGKSPFLDIIVDQNKGRDYADRARWERGGEDEQKKDVADEAEEQQVDQTLAAVIQDFEPKSITGRFEFPPVMR